MRNPLFAKLAHGAKEYPVPRREEHETKHAKLSRLARFNGFGAFMITRASVMGRLLLDRFWCRGRNVL